mgnify:CR=1 FL=1
MAEQRNFLLGKGERLTEPVVVRSGGTPRVPPYTFEQARARLRPMIKSAADAFDNLPPGACPDDQVVGRLTLNPEYISKSAFPGALLNAAGLRTVGSRPRRMKPAQRSKGREPEETITTELYVAAPRKAFREWSQKLANWNPASPEAEQLAAVEEFTAPAASEKVKSIVSDSEELLFEVALHSSGFADGARVLKAFAQYAHELGLEAELDRRIVASGLCFLPVKGKRDKANDVANFAFLRVIREMPRLRLLRPTFRSAALPSASITLPTAPAVDPSIRAAIFDGGLPDGHPLWEWATAVEPPGIGPALPEFLEHGLTVTSAALFGHINPNDPLPTPYANIEHHRVLDGDPTQDPYELYEVLSRISAALMTKRYDFINLSIGPALPIEDDGIHAWTAVLDDHLGDGETLATIAVGNGGEGDPENGFNRIQVPSDCVNGLAVGACDTKGPGWKRAPYSSVGPGRSPGVVKPDLVSFGGSLAEPYLALAPGATPTLMPTGGTSFAAPDTMRLGMGVRAHFGSSLRPLAIRTLLVHSSEPSDLPRSEVGWGRAARNLEDVVICPPGSVRVVYQGEINAAKYLRASIPLPAGSLPGMVRISATLCFATAVDPHHPSNYTRSGLEVLFRPHEDHYEPKAVHPKTKGFFQQAKLYMTEDELRRDAHKWDNCLHASVRMQGRSLKNPVFDIHYNARADGRDFRPDEKLQYALVITVEAPRAPDLYDQVVRRYRTQLEALKPVVEIPIRY